MQVVILSGGKSTVADVTSNQSFKDSIIAAVNGTGTPLVNPEPVLTPLAVEVPPKSLTAYEFLSQKGLSVAEVQGIFTVSTMADSHRIEGKVYSYPVPNQVFRIGTFNETIEVKMSEEFGYVVNGDLPDTEYFSTGQRYVKNPLKSPENNGSSVARSSSS